MQTSAGTWDSPDLLSTKTENRYVKQTVPTVVLFLLKKIKSTFRLHHLPGCLSTLLKCLALYLESTVITVMVIKNVNTSIKNQYNCNKSPAGFQYLFGSFSDCWCSLQHLLLQKFFILQKKKYQTFALLKMSFDSFSASDKENATLFLAENVSHVSPPLLQRH